MIPLYELREQHVAPGAGEPVGLWHVVERGRLTGLCGHVVDPRVDARPLADLAVIDRVGCCGNCEEVFRDTAAKVAGV